jgi:hypothetical protein
MPPSRSHHQLQAVAIRVIEVEAALVPRTTRDGHAIFLQLGFEGFVGARRHVQRQMVEVVARGEGLVTARLEQCTPRCSATLERGAPGLPLRNVSTRN